MYEQNNAFPHDSDHEPATVTPIQNNQKRAVGTAAAGTVALGAAAYALSRLDDTESSDANGAGMADGSDGSGDGGASGNGAGNGAAATLVTPVSLPGDGSGGNGSGSGDGVDHRSLDDMTFEEAFAAARHAQGPGHHFTWHGGLYNTFYQEELDSMSMADRLAFVESLGLESDDDDDRPARHNRPVPAAHHRQPSAQQHHAHQQHAAPVLAATSEHGQPAATEPMTVVPIAATTTHTEVVPVPTGQHDAHNVDMLTASHLGDEQHHTDGIGGIDSIEHHADGHHGETDHDGSDDDQQVHFTY